METTGGIIWQQVILGGVDLDSIGLIGAYTVMAW
jgi:hypothetical protein